jgi:hypothetical protein
MNALVEAFAPPKDPGAEFERCRAWLEAALEEAHGTHTIDDVREGVRTGRCHFWPGENSAAVTEVFQFPRARVLNVFLAGGDLGELLKMEAYFCSWAAHLGCSQIVLTGRPGWAKALQSLGWQRTAVVLAKSIEVGSTT